MDGLIIQYGYFKRKFLSNQFCYEITNHLTLSRCRLPSLSRLTDGKGLVGIVSM